MKKLVMIFFVVMIQLVSAQPPYQYTMTDLKARLPEPVLDSHPGYIDMYWKAWELAQQHIQANPQPGNGLMDYWMDEAYLIDLLFQWDTDFMTLFGRYGYFMWPSIASLDNFYHTQRGDGAISKGIQLPAGTFSHGDIFPPL